MKIIQWNIQSITSNFSELKVLLNNLNPSCVCLQETMLGDKKFRPPSNYNIVQSPKKRDDGHERSVAILVNKNNNFRTVQLNTSLQAVAIKIWLGKWYTVCSIYLPHITVAQNELETLINQLPEPFLLLGDMNARHHLWGEPVDNDKGRIFENILLTSDISIINSPSPTHFHIQTGSHSTIDLSLTSNSCSLDFSHRVLENLHGSDHYPIILDMIQPENNAQPSLRYKIEKADWTTFSNLTRNYAAPDSTNIDEIVDGINSFFLECANATIPKSRGRKKKPPLPWWNEECRIADLERKRAERAVKRNRSIPNKIAFKRCRAVCRRIFNKYRRESWVQYVSSLNTRTSFHSVCKKVNKMSGKFTTHPPPLLEEPSGTVTQDPTITSNLFAQAFASVSNENNYSREFIRFKRQNETKPVDFSSNEPQTYNEQFSLEEFKSSLSSTNETSPGSDAITYSMIKNSHLNFQLCILQLFNKIYSMDIFPSVWKLATIIPIPKPGKDHSNPLNYRPISLTSCLCKLFEKMVNSRLVWYLEKEGLIQEHQSGFRRNRSTTDCIVQLECDFRNAISRREHTIAIFFDLTKAYDMSWKHGILQKLQQFGLSGHLPKFIKNFLSSRTVQVRVGNTLSDTYNVEEGVPQGSVLSCTLFMIAINDVVKNFPVGVRSALYVDDLVIYMSGNSTNLLERQLQISINRLEQWCKKTGFIFSPAKTFAMHVCRKKRCPKMAHQFTMNNSPIHSKETIKYLGVTIDNSLTWTTHIKNLRSNCLRKLGLLKTISHKSWGADSKTLLRLYTMLIKPKLEYGSEAYASACKSQMSKIEPIQNQAIRTAIGAFKSSPIASIQAVSGTKPLQFSLDVKLLNYFLRIIVNGRNPINLRIQASEAFNESSEDESTDSELPKLSFLSRCKKALCEYGIPFHEISDETPPRCPPWEIGNIDICTEMYQYQKGNTSDDVLRTCFLEHLEGHSHNYQIFTDGSKTSEGVSFSVASNTTSISHRIKGENSIFTAELYAIKEAVMHANSTPHVSITIITDSKSSIQALAKPFSENPIVKNIHKMLHSNGKLFSLCWVPSHVGVPGNEKADRLARAAISNPQVLQTPITRDDLKAKIRREAYSKWKEKWRATSSTNKLREITDKVTPLPNSICSNRYWERALARLRIGHSRLTHGYLMAREEQPECDRCTLGAMLTIRHLLVECPALQNLRIQHFHRSRVTMRQLLNNGDTSHGGALFRFVQASDILSCL